MEDLEVALEDIEEGLEAEMEATSAHISALNAEREQAMAGAGDLLSPPDIRYHSYIT